MKYYDYTNKQKIFTFVHSYNYTKNKCITKKEARDTKMATARQNYTI